MHTEMCHESLMNLVPPHGSIEEQAVKEGCTLSKLVSHARSLWRNSPNSLDPTLAMLKELFVKSPK
eukprot:1346915-Pyramimonas_sp.AAC.1